MKTHTPLHAGTISSRCVVCERVGGCGWVCKRECVCVLREGRVYACMLSSLLGFHQREEEEKEAKKDKGLLDKLLM